MSQQFLGTHIDAIYHTALVIDGIEYYFASGIQTCRAGTTHHGKPMEIIELGRTDLPIDVILEYLDSLKAIYTPEVHRVFVQTSTSLIPFTVLRPIRTQLQQLLPRFLHVPRWQGYTRSHHLASADSAQHAIWADAQTPDRSGDAPHHPSSSTNSRPATSIGDHQWP